MANHLSNQEPHLAWTQHWHWEFHKEELRILFDSGIPYSAICDVMSNTYNFNYVVRTYKRHFQRWGWRRRNAQNADEEGEEEDEDEDEEDEEEEEQKDEEKGEGEEKAKAKGDGETKDEDHEEVKEVGKEEMKELNDLDQHDVEAGSSTLLHDNLAGLDYYSSPQEHQAIDANLNEVLLTTLPFSEPTNDWIFHAHLQERLHELTRNGNQILSKAGMFADMLEDGQDTKHGKDGGKGKEKDDDKYKEMDTSYFLDCT